MSKLNINEQLRQNSWLSVPAESVPEFILPRVECYSQIWNRVTTNNLITAIVGLRRVGKTTILKQIACDLIAKSGVDKYKVLYWSFEESPANHSLQDLIRVIEHQVEKYPGQKLYLLFDEIQYVDYWNPTLKKYWDLYPETLKFVISGSSSLFIRTHARESLAGRILETWVPPVGFSDFLNIKYGQQIPSPGFFQPAKFGNEIEAQTRFEQYLKCGEFPALYKLPGDAERHEYVRDWVIGKVVEHDIPRYKRIIRSYKLRNLVEALTDRPGQLIELQNLARDMELSRVSLSSYLGILEQTYLMHQVYNGNLGFRTRKNRLRKIYPSSVNLYAMRSDFDAGLAVETFVANYLRRHKAEFYFWRQTPGREIDFLVRQPQTVLPVEVKYQNQIRDSDTETLVGYCQANHLKRAVVVSKYVSETQARSGVDMTIIPACHLL